MQDASTKHSGQLSTFTENLSAIHEFVKTSVNEKALSIGKGISALRDDITAAFNEKPGYHNLLTPVNNFLKDLSQINRDFEEEQNRENEYHICLNGKMVPASKVLSMPMEENY
jgi:hypothetical protein